MIKSKHPPFNARDGLFVADAAARAWANDALLVYIENDESVDSQGAAGRWSRRQLVAIAGDLLPDADGCGAPGHGSGHGVRIP